MRTYIFTIRELEAIQQFIQTRKRNPTVNKLIHFIRHNKQILTHVELFLELWRLAHYKASKSQAKLPPGRPPKILKSE